MMVESEHYERFMTRHVMKHVHFQLAQDQRWELGETLLL